jgi:hypothetical protein
MQGDWAAQSEDGAGLFSPQIGSETLLASARVYYRMADAMMLARAEEGDWLTDSRFGSRGG